jgi:hypothetical protein
LDRQQSIVDRQFIQNAAMMNMAMDDMDAAVGFSAGGGRVPIREIALAMTGKTVLNNINITNSSVGVVNTGDLARIDAAITITKHTDVEAVGAHIQRLTQAIIDASQLDAANKREMLDLVQSLADQVIRERKSSVIKALLKSIEERAQGVAAILEIVQGLAAAVRGVFGP